MKGTTQILIEEKFLNYWWLCFVFSNFDIQSSQQISLLQEESAKNGSIKNKNGSINNKNSFEKFLQTHLLLCTLFQWSWVKSLVFPATNSRFRTSQTHSLFHRPLRKALSHQAFSFFFHRDRINEVIIYPRHLKL